MQKTIDKYVGVLCEARKKKGLTEQQARDNLQDINVYGTLMVLAGDADGMVSGATTTTANTIRPALQVCTTCWVCLKPCGLCTDIPFVPLSIFVHIVKLLFMLLVFCSGIFAWLLRLVMPASGLATQLAMKWTQEPSQQLTQPEHSSRLESL